MKWILICAAGLIAFLTAMLWWLLLSGSDAAATAPPLFPIETWRAELAGDDILERPTQIRLIEVGSDVAPKFAAQAGRFGVDWRTSYGGFEISTPTGSIFVDSGIDAETSHIMARSPETSVFDQAEYDALLTQMETAQHILLTHAHRDHVMAVARHPQPSNIASRLRLNKPQKSALGGFTRTGTLPAAFEGITPYFDDVIKQLAPGVLVAPTPGHTPGSQVVFVTLQNGREFLFIGDIVWAISNITDLKIRPQFTQILIFDPNEDRAAIKQQVRALHDLSKEQPDLVFLPAHDRDHLLSLVESDTIALGLER